MNFSENLRLAWSCVKANKMRSVLTMLGIIIGISAVITISTIGTSLKQSIAKSVSDLAGANTLYAGLSDTSGEYDITTIPAITLDLLEDYSNTFSEDLNGVGAERGLGNGDYEYGTDAAHFYVTGETGNVTTTYGVEMLEGRDITLQDSRDKRNVAVVSDQFVKYALNGEDPIGRRINLKIPEGFDIEVYIIGVYKFNINTIGDYSDRGKAEKDQTTTIFVPLGFVYDELGIPKSEQTVYFFNIYAKPGADPDKIIDETVDWFNSNVITPDSTWIMEVESMEKQLGQITSILNMVTVAISVIAAISLIVGGIGVMNIMLVSVVERTKEIGIRKALGAKNKVIEKQFLVEAVLICSIGGIIGILLGMFNGVIISLVAKQIVANTSYSFLSVVVRPPVTATLIAFGFSMLVGVVFGLYPARRAARLSPIDALRYE